LEEKVRYTFESFNIPIMKNLTRAILFTAILSVSIGFQAKSQRLFDGVPENIQFESKLIEGLFSANPGTSADIKFSPNFHIIGIVKSNQKIYDNLQTIVIEASNYSKAKLFISKIIDDDKTVKYVGRIISRASQDGFEIKCSLAGNCSLKKISLQDMIVE
jgi:hypothetical protein